MSRVKFETVVPDVVAGDPEATQRLMAAAYPWMATYCRRIVGDPDLAADIALSFWGKLVTEGLIQKYDAERGYFMPWMRTQLHNALSRYLRDRQEVDMTPVEPALMDINAGPGGTPEEEAIASEMAAQILVNLTGEEQALYYGLMEGLDAKELSRRIDRTQRTTEDKLLDLRAKIAKLII